MRAERSCRPCRSHSTSSPSSRPAASIPSPSWSRADAARTSSLYDLANTTARRGWELGIPAATYWFVTPEREPPEGLADEGIEFIGSTYAEVRGGVVLLDPQDERIEPDRIVSLSEDGELLEQT